MTDNQQAEKYHFYVDSTKYSTNETALTGAQIKTTASVPANYQLILEEKGGADKVISDGESINLAGEPKHFLAVPPATFGAK